MICFSRDQGKTGKRMNSTASPLMVGTGAGGGDSNACAVCMLKCKCPLLWVSRYAHNYEPVSEVLILMAFALMALFFFLSCLITNQCCLASYCEMHTLHWRARAFLGAAEEPARGHTLGRLASPHWTGSPIPSPHPSLLFGTDL